MRINIVIPSPGRSGGLDVIYRYARMFGRKGQDVVLYTPVWPYCLSPRDFFIRKYAKRCKRFLSNIYHYLLKKEPQRIPGIEIRPVLTVSDRSVRDADVVIATAWPTAYDVSSLCDRKGKKVYFIQDYEIWDDEKLGKKSYTLPLHKIVISNWIKEQIRAQGINMDDARMIHNGIELSLYENDKSFEKKNSYNCLMLNHKLAKKGRGNGLAAFELARRKYPALTLTMFGLQEGTGLPDYVRYEKNPSPERLKQIYREADIYIFPSLEEGWGLTVIEAMAAKCAVVGTKAGCLLEIGQDGENCLLSEPGDVEKMTENIEQLVSNPEKIEYLGRNAFYTVRGMDWERCADEYMEYLEKIAVE